MNTFSICLGPVTEKGTETGGTICLRSAVDPELVEIVVPKHKPGAKGGTQTEESLGFVPTATLARVLGAVLQLSGGGCSR